MSTVTYEDIRSKCTSVLLLETFVPFRPLPKQSFRMGNGRAYTPKKLVEYEKQLKGWWKDCWKNCLTIKVPVRIELCYHFKFRKDDKLFAEKADFILHCGKVDNDNLGKLLLDSMQGIIIEDDKQVCFCESCKVRSSREGTSVKLFGVNQEFGKNC